MDEERTNKFTHIFPAYSAIYHAIDGMIFMRDDFAHKVIKILPDENNRNKKIMNLQRLKEKTSRKIVSLYNRRIDTYKLLFDKLSLKQKEIFEIKTYKLVSSMEDSDDYSGKHMIFPRTFVCKKCGDFRAPSKEEWSKFDLARCRNPKCDGEYEQVSILMFCEKCGKIEPLHYSCAKHGNKNIRLIRTEKDSLLTWKVVCQSCYEEGSKSPIDIFLFPCDHCDENGKKICDEEKAKFKPLTIKEGGIFTPVVITSVDIPPAESVEVEDLEYLLLGLHLGKFDQISKEINREVNLSTIKSYFEAYKNPDLKNLLLPKLQNFIDLIDEKIKNLKDDYANVNLENLNEYLAIKGAFSDEGVDITSYDKYLESIEDATIKKMRKENFKSLKNSFGIKDIIYIPSINLISSCVGLIHGINKFYEREFVPHFSPIWENTRKKEKIISYAYPFETEGLLIELDRIRVCNWLIDNGILVRDKKPIDEKEATDVLLKIKSDTREYTELKKLIHTLSHILIKRSSLYTGLDSDSCSELLFVNNAAILIYATSNINIGGFAFVFEHSLQDWFRDIYFEINECTFDPACIFERGACFSCLYLPEYVCSEFNKDLDRDVFIGSKRYNTPYWVIK